MLHSSTSRFVLNCRHGYPDRQSYVTEEILSLDAPGCLGLADALADTAENAPSIGFLREGRAKAWILGPLPGFKAAIVRWDDLPEEPVAFGSDPDAMAKLLAEMEGWTSVDTPALVAATLSRLITGMTSRSTHLHEGVVYQLLSPVVVIRNEHVRELTPADEPLVSPEDRQAARDEGWRIDFSTLHAGAIVEGRVVSFVGGGKVSSRFGDMGAFTLMAFRGRGYATAAACIVASRLQDQGLIPIWSTGVGNPASMAVPAKLGFSEVLPRRFYICFD